VWGYYSSALPYRQLRKTVSSNLEAGESALPYRQLRK